MSGCLRPKYPGVRVQLPVLTGGPRGVPREERVDQPFWSHVRFPCVPSLPQPTQLMKIIMDMPDRPLSDRPEPGVGEEDRPWPCEDCESPTRCLKARDVDKDGKRTHCVRARAGTEER